MTFRALPSLLESHLEFKRNLSKLFNDRIVYQFYKLAAAPSQDDEKTLKAGVDVVEMSSRALDAGNF